MKTRIGYTIIVLLFVFLQVAYTQQRDTLKLTNIPKRAIGVPCPDLFDCYENITECYQNYDTLYVVYGVDSSHQRGVVWTSIEYSNEKRRMNIVIPKLSNSNFNYLNIKHYRNTYLFKKKKDYYVFQKTVSMVMGRHRSYKLCSFERRRILKELQEQEVDESEKISIRR